MLVGWSVPSFSFVQQQSCVRLSFFCFLFVSFPFPWFCYYSDVSRHLIKQMPNTLAHSLCDCCCRLLLLLLHRIIISNWSNESVRRQGFRLWVFRFVRHARIVEMWTYASDVTHSHCASQTKLRIGRRCGAITWKHFLFQVHFPKSVYVCVLLLLVLHSFDRHFLSMARYRYSRCSH